MERQLLFEDDADREFFLRTLLRSCSKRDAEIFAWVLMGNHVHLLVHASQPELSSLMKSTEGSYAHYFNRRYNRVGSLFQGRFGVSLFMTMLVCFGDCRRGVREGMAVFTMRFASEREKCTAC